MGLGSLISTAYRGLVFVSYGFMNFTSTKRSREFGQQRVNSIPSQPFRDRIMVLTGANSGLGLETARQWYMGGGVCYMLCRSKERGEEAVQSILAMGNGQSSTGRLQLCVVDVSRPQQLADFIRQFRQSSKYIDVLVNNAGVLLNERRLTAEGLEESFATNVVGPYLLAQGLMPLLIQSPHGGRVINVSSGGMLTARLNPNDLQCSQMAKWDGSAAYAHHKRLLCYWTAEEARKQAPAVFFASTHPGWVDTPGVRSSIPDFFQTFQPYLRNLVEGVDTVLWLSGGEIDARQLPNGEFWFDRAVASQHLPLAGTRSSEQDIADTLQQIHSIASPYLQQL